MREIGTGLAFLMASEILQAGSKVASRVYFYSIRAGNYSAMWKMVVIQ